MFTREDILKLATEIYDKFQKKPDCERLSFTYTNNCSSPHILTSFRIVVRRDFDDRRGSVKLKELYGYSGYLRFFTFDSFESFHEALYRLLMDYFYERTKQITEAGLQSLTDSLDCDRNFKYF